MRLQLSDCAIKQSALIQRTLSEDIPRIILNAGVRETTYMMQVTEIFGRLNALLGTSSNAPSACKYVWDDNSVVLKNSYFDEQMFRLSKLTQLMEKETCLSIADLQEVVETVLNQNPQLILDISYASPESWKVLDSQLDTLLHEAVISAENEAQLRISRENIIAARPLTDGWMSLNDVNAVLALSNKPKFDTPNRGKFVNRCRQ